MTDPTALVRIKAYLPPHLAKDLDRQMASERAQAILDHLVDLHAALAGYLPRLLVEWIRQDPTSGKLRGAFHQGSVLFADVSGFTAMSEKLQVLGKEGAEEMTGIVNSYFETMLGISDRHGGDLLKFGGDALMIFFEGEDGPGRAVTAACEMQAGMAQYTEVETSQGIFPLRMSVGIGSGSLLLTNLGTASAMNYAVFGDALVSMGQAEDLAQADQIIVDDVTQVATSSIAKYIECGNGLWQLEASDIQSLATVSALGARPPGPLEASGSGSDPLSQALQALPTIQGLSAYMPGELLQRLILDPLRPRLHGSHRPVTVLFANFIGVDPLAQALGGEHLEFMLAILNAYYAPMSEILARFGGTISRVDSYVVGHRILALFGALRAHEDDPQRAVQAGLAMNEAMVQINREVCEILGALPEPGLETGPSPLTQRIGINTGFVFAGNVGSADRREYTVMGDDVNLTARLMGVAREGEVLIGHSTARRVEASFELDEQESVKVKGKTDPVRSFVVRGAAARTDRRSGAAAVKLVGRDRETELAGQALQAALGSDGRVLVIRGASGIGKTRLLQEVIRMAEGSDMDLLMGSCLSYGATLTYHPWVEILRDHFGIAPGDSTADRIQALERGLATVGESDWTPVIGTVMGLEVPENDLTRDLDPKLRRQRVLDLVVKLLQERSKRRPTLLVIEDAHWADSASMDLISYLARNLSGHPILLVLPHRPDPDLPGWSELPHAVDLPLSELSAEASVELIGSILGVHELPQAALDRIQRKAAGNPLFLGELLRALQESGGIERDSAGVWVAVESQAEVELPDTIHGIIISRMDRLGAADRGTLQVASVVGPRFALGTLLGVLPAEQPVDEVRGQLERMQRSGLLDANGAAIEDYRFVHLTTQEVVYESLAFERRRGLHCQIGEFLERAHTDTIGEQVNLLAYHFFQGQAWPKALEYNMQAGWNAQSEFANQIAITSFQNVLQATSKLAHEREVSQEQALAHTSLSEVLTLVGGYEDALGHLASARELAEAQAELLDGGGRMADLCRRTADVYERQSEYDTAFEWLERGLGLIDPADPSIEGAQLLLLGTGIYRRQGKNDEAIEWCRRGLEAAAQIRSREGRRALARAYYTLSGIHWRRGELEDAIQYAQDGLEIYEQVEDVVGQARALTNLSNALADRGDWERAIEASERSLAITERVGNIQSQGFAANNLAQIYLDRGELGRARELFTESNMIWQKLGALLPEAVTLSNLAQVHIQQENWDEAERALARSQELFEQIGTEDYLAELERRWGEFRQKTGDPEGALKHAERSVELASGGEAALELGISLRSLGQVQLARGDSQAAAEALRESLRILEELSSEFEAARTVIALAQLAMEGHAELKPKNLDQAISTFAKLGAAPELERAQDLRRKLTA